MIIQRFELDWNKYPKSEYIYYIYTYLSVSLFLHHVSLHCTSIGETEEHISGCLARDTTWTIILYTEHSSVSRCRNDKMTQKYQGDMKYLFILSGPDDNKNTSLTITVLFLHRLVQVHTFRRQRNLSPW